MAVTAVGYMMRIFLWKSLQFFNVRVSKEITQVSQHHFAHRI